MTTLTATVEVAVKNTEAPPDQLAFTHYVKALEQPAHDMEALFETAWRKLKKVLGGELRKRSLWFSPPAYLGLIGWESWSATATGPGQTEGPLEELLPDCYTAIFHRQLPVLLTQLKVNEAIDGLVVKFVGYFLSERQKDHDPLGYRIFEMLRSAVRSAVDAGELHVLRGRKTIVNSTVLAAAEDADPERAASVEDLRPIVQKWNGDLLPGLVTAMRAERRQVVERLSRHLFDLESDGVSVFWFRDLIQPMKQDVRARWAALSGRGLGDVAKKPSDGREEGGAIDALIEVFRPRYRIHETDSYRKLVACVVEMIERTEDGGRTRRYLETLWNFLCGFAVDDEVDDMPSHRKVGEVLHIPRERLPGLYGKLGELARRCQARFAGMMGKVVEIDRHRSSGGRHE